MVPLCIVKAQTLGSVGAVLVLGFMKKKNTIKSLNNGHLDLSEMNDSCSLDTMKMIRYIFRTSTK